MERIDELKRKESMLEESVKALDKSLMELNTQFNEEYDLYGMKFTNTMTLIADVWKKVEREMTRLSNRLDNIRLQIELLEDTEEDTESDNTDNEENTDDNNTEGSEEKDEETTENEENEEE